MCNTQPGDPVPPVILYEDSPDNQVKLTDLYKGKAGFFSTMIYFILRWNDSACTSSVVQPAQKNRIVINNVNLQ